MNIGPQAKLTPSLRSIVENPASRFAVSHLALATQTLTQVSSWSNNISAAHITCRTHIVFSGPSYYCHQDLAFDATVDLRLFLNLHSEVVASVPDPTGDMRPSSSWAFGSFPAPIVMRPSGTHRPRRTGYGACQACSPTLLVLVSGKYTHGRDHPRPNRMLTTECP